MLATLLLFVSIPVSLLFLTVNLFRDSHGFKNYLLLFAFTMGLFAYCVSPSESMDLYRYFAMLDELRGSPFSSAFTWADDGLVVKNLLFWMVAQTGNDHLLSGISTCVTYGILSYITCKTCSESRFLPLVLVVQLLAMPFLEVASNVRNILAFSVAIYAAYRDLYEHKLDAITIALYAASVFIHIAGVTIVICRLVVYLFRRFPSIGMVATLFIPVAVIRSHEMLTAFASLFSGSIGSILTRAVAKAYSSSVNTSEYAITRLQSGYFVYTRLVVVGVLVIIAYCALKLIRQGTNKEADFAALCLILAAIAIAWAFNNTVKYWVYAVAAIMACGPSLVSEFDRLESKVCDNWANALFRLVLAAACGGRFVLELYYIAQHLNVQDYVLSIMTTNLTTVVLQCIS